MNEKLEKFSEYINGKTVALIGAGVSNMAAVDFLLSRGARLTVRDKQEDAEKAALLASKGVKTVFGEGYFADMSEEDIRRYVATGEPMGKAGAYAIQGHAARYITGIEGDYFNVVGLPVRRLYTTVKDAFDITL